MWALLGQSDMFSEYCDMAKDGCMEHGKMDRNSHWFYPIMQYSHSKYILKSPLKFREKTFKY